MSIKQEIQLVKAMDLTPGDLRKSRLPDASLDAINVACITASGAPFTAVHNRISQEDYALLHSPVMNEADFRDVARIVSSIFRVAPKAEVYHRTIGRCSDIFQVISLPHPLTQKLVVRYVEEYMRRFQRVEIPVVYYRNVPREILQNPGFPKEKLSDR